MRWGICVAVLMLLVPLARGKRYTGPLNPPVYATVGATAGILSGAAQIGGPPIVAFWLGAPREPGVIRANIMLYSSLASLLGLAAYFLGGLMRTEVFHLALFATPGYVIGVVIGLRLYPLASPAFFRASALALIFLAALLGMPLFDTHL